MGVGGNVIQGATYKESANVYIKCTAISPMWPYMAGLYNMYDILWVSLLQR